MDAPTIEEPAIGSKVLNAEGRLASSFSQSEFAFTGSLVRLGIIFLDAVNSRWLKIEFNRLIVLILIFIFLDL